MQILPSQLRVFPAVLALLFLAATAATPAGAAPEAKAWKRWNAHDQSSTTQIDHTSWDTVLAAIVLPGPDGVARVDYAALAEDSKLSGLLDSYLNALQTTEVSTLTRDEQKTFWINLYNALTVQVVRDHHPVDSIKDIDISPGLFSSGPWGAEIAEIEGEALTLDDIEHRILRPLWGDERVHYALNCASIGCPDLRAQAWRVESLDEALNEAARIYVNHPRGVSVDGDDLVVSSIYDWFEDDFGGGEEGVLRHLRKYASPEHATAIAGAANIRDHRYDWDLNGPAGENR